MARVHFLHFLLLLYPKTLTALLSSGLNTTNASYKFYGTLPPSLASQLSTNCTKAYASPIACDPKILMSPLLVNDKLQTLEIVCQPQCGASLFAYARNVRRECGELPAAAKGKWLESAGNGTVVLDMYYGSCLRDLSTNNLCTISDTDFELAWDAAIDESPSTSSSAKQAFCTNSCMVQTIVLKAPTSDNMSNLRRICGAGIVQDVQKYPFVDAMRFAGVEIGGSGGGNGSAVLGMPGADGDGDGVGVVVQITDSGGVIRGWSISIMMTGIAAVMVGL